MNKKVLLKLSIALTLGGSLLTPGFADPGERGNDPAAAEQSEAQIFGAVSNGDGVVTFDGEEVWSGRITEGLQAIAKVIEEVQYAAAWDGERLLWENVAGAGKRLEGAEDHKPEGSENAEAGDRGDSAAELRELIESGASPEEIREAMAQMLADKNGKPNLGANSSSLSCESINGRGKVTYNGKVVWRGKTSGNLNGASTSDYAAAWDGDRLVWENTKGAGAAVLAKFPDLLSKPGKLDRRKPKKRSNKRR